MMRLPDASKNGSVRSAISEQKKATSRYNRNMALIKTSKIIIS